MDLYIENDPNMRGVFVTAEAHEHFDYASLSMEAIVDDFLSGYNDTEGSRTDPLSQEEINEIGEVAAALRDGAQKLTDFINANRPI